MNQSRGTESPNRLPQVERDDKDEMIAGVASSRWLDRVRTHSAGWYHDVPRSDASQPTLSFLVGF